MIRSVLVYHPLHGAALAEMLAAREQSLDVRLAAQEGDIPHLLPDAEALVIGAVFPFHLLPTAKKLRWIQATAAGVEKFLDGVTLPRGLRLTRLVGTFGRRMSEYAFAYLLATQQDVPRVVRQQAARRWDAFHPHYLVGKNLLVVGVGEIGGAVARLGAAFGMNVAGVVRRPRAIRGLRALYTRETLHDGLRDAHFVVVVTPLTDDTRGMFDAAAFAAMRDDAVFLNMGRGPLADEGALVEALRRNRPRWAVLDVFDEEPLPPDHPLWTSPNVILTPHLAAHTQRDEVVDTFCDNLARLRAGKRLKLQVDVRRGY
ncbi:MAG: D-2-hydroxyacid dehydrogenase [Armatimonadetes bacterium]|nr:D-2-hydroxyacid dehydrogenase [Armatimonadota bacterium]